MRKIRFTFGLSYYGVGLIIISLLSAQLNHEFTKRHFIIIISGLILLTLAGIRYAKKRLRQLQESRQ
jgi:general stress protein CsbA